MNTRKHQHIRAIVKEVQIERLLDGIAKREKLTPQSQQDMRWIKLYVEEIVYGRAIESKPKVVRESFYAKAERLAKEKDL